MAVERAGIRSVPKPWGRADLRPFAANESGQRIGEVWFTRSAAAPRTALLLKLLFTAEPLSIQVHPTDREAASMDLPNGKSEMWMILAAEPGAEVALGLRQPLTPAALRRAIEDGSIADLVAWRPAHKGDVIAVPAGTIHAIGAGLVIAEVQQNSDATFRLFDFGRGRALHVDEAVATADLGPLAARAAPVALADGRTLLVVEAGFVVERIVLAGGAAWAVEAGGETWFLVLDGGAVIGDLTVATGQAVFLDAVEALIAVGPAGLVALVAYPAPEPIQNILRDEWADRRCAPITLTTPTKANP